MFYDYLETLEDVDDESESEDKQNNNNENREIGKTLTEMLKNGEFVPDVSLTRTIFSQ